MKNSGMFGVIKMKYYNIYIDATFLNSVTDIHTLKIGLSADGNFSSFFI